MACSIWAYMVLEPSSGRGWVAGSQYLFLLPEASYADVLPVLAAHCELTRGTQAEDGAGWMGWRPALSQGQSWFFEIIMVVQSVKALYVGTVMFLCSE